MSSPDTKVCHIGVLLIPDFSAISYASAIEPLYICNKLLGDTRYKVTHIGLESGEVMSSTGMRVAVQQRLQDTTEIDRLMIIGCSPAPAGIPDSLLHWLKDNAHRMDLLLGVASGSYLLAEAGLLRGLKASILWKNLAELRQRFPDVWLSTDLFSLDAHLATCRAGTAAMDMITMVIARDHGREIGESLSHYFIRERAGATDVDERKTLSEQVARSQPKLAEAVALMEANIDEPLSTDELAQHVDLSRRQLERLFKKFLDSVPSRYYNQMRLEHGRDLLLSTQRSIADIGLSCGYSSGAHFSTAYRSLFGLTPSEERQMKSRT